MLLTAADSLRSGRTLRKTLTLWSGERSQRIRRQRRWSQEELAFQSGLHRTYISGIERGTRNPTVRVLAQLAEALGVTPAALLEANA